MAVAIYSTDLKVIADAEAIGTWDEPAGDTYGGAPGVEADYFIENTHCISKTYNATGMGGMMYVLTSGIIIPSPGGVYTWTYFGAPNAIATEAASGMMLVAGSGLSNYSRWTVGGSDTYTYGGWVCNVVDPTGVAANSTYGTVSRLSAFGMLVNVVNNVAKGNPCACDVIRYGRGTIQCISGDAGGYATFLGAAAKNDANDVSAGYNRWGIFQSVTGGYLFQGHFLMGTNTLPVDFRDANRTINIKNTKKVVPSFNLFEVQNASSYVDWTSCVFQTLGTVSRGNFLATDNADINITSCSFTDMGTFVFQSNSTIQTSTFRRCDLITQNGAAFDECVFDSSHDTTKALLANNLSNITNCSFVSDGTGYGIEISATGSYTMNGNTFIGFGASGTTDACLYNNSAGQVTIALTAGDTPTFNNGASANTTINMSALVTLEGFRDGSEIRAYLGTDPATSIELGGVESGSISYSFGQNCAGSSGYIIVHAIDYEAWQLNLVYSADNQTIPVQQQLDRQYYNP